MRACVMHTYVDWTFAGISKPYTAVGAPPPPVESQRWRSRTVLLACVGVVVVLCLGFGIVLIASTSSGASELVATPEYLAIVGGGARARKLDILYDDQAPDGLAGSLCMSNVRGDFSLHAPVSVGVPPRPVTYKTPAREVFTAVESHDYAEVSHCGGSDFEMCGAWHYVMHGTGMWVDVGHTISFASHQDAALHFLGRRCNNVFNMDHLWNPICDAELDEIMMEATRAGFDSIQFLKYCDAYCGGCGHELVVLGVEGGATCPSNLTYYSAPGVPCDCVAWGASLRGTCAMCASTSAALDDWADRKVWPKTEKPN